MNSERGQPSFVLDARVTKFFVLGRESWRLGLFAEFYNLTNRANFGAAYAGIANRAGGLRNFLVDFLTLTVPIAKIERHELQQLRLFFGTYVCAREPIGHLDLRNRKSNDQQDAQQNG